MKRIAIIGAGASGMAAAISAAHALDEVGAQADIVLLEKLPRAGKKLLATGNGRCNLTNVDAAPQHYRSSNLDAAGAVLAGYGADEILRFFDAMGLWCAAQEAGRVYPMSNQATTVLESLLLELERCGVRLLCNFDVREIRRAGEKFEIAPAQGSPVVADAVILAAGGRAAPAFGTDGGGFALAQALGHSCLRPYPALVPLKTAEDVKALKGIRAVCGVTLRQNGRVVAQETGEVQFTEYGLSGIPIMQMSNHLGGMDTSWTILLDLFPDAPTAALRAHIEQRTRRHPDETLETLLAGTVHKRLGYAALKAAGIQPLSRACGSLSDAEFDRLADALKGLRFTIAGTLAWAQSQVTGGGVPLREIDPTTMESRITPGLYLCGELLDVVGECGGFNLHWAWVTGMRAGRVVVARRNALR